MKRIFKNGILLFILINMFSFMNVYASDVDRVIASYVISFFVYVSPIFLAIIIGYVTWRNRQVERSKKNVEDRNHTGAHAALDSRNVRDREFIKYIDETENKTNLLLAAFFDNLTNLKYIKAHCSPELYESIVHFIKSNEKEDNYIVVKDTVINSNEIKTKDGNIFSTDVLIECYNYMEDSRGHYRCGYKVNKEFVRKRIEFSYNGKEIFIITIKDM